MSEISVVIPTYNRADGIVDTLRLCHRHAGGVDLEYIVIDDGSVDDTPTRLDAVAAEIPNLRYKSIDNGGAGRARNHGAEMATSDIVLFLGDDIKPTSDDFFRTHLDLHRQMPGRDVAVLGKVAWPDRDEADTNFVMAHVQGLGGEQFAYAFLTPYEWLDWRFFYTANISVKRDLVDDWLEDGFRDVFRTYGYEDIELAYRLNQRPDGLRIFYAPLSFGLHFHQYSLDGFLGRQFSAGLMARTFVDMHPAAAAAVGVAGLRAKLREPVTAADEAKVSDLISVIEGIRSWAKLLEASGNLGRDYWHGELLKAVFILSYSEGFIAAAREPDANLAAAYELALTEFYLNFQRTVFVEGVGDAMPNFTSVVNIVAGDQPAAAAGKWIGRSAIIAKKALNAFGGRQAS